MPEIGSDGDMGDLGKDRLGKAGSGVSPETIAEFESSLTNFYKSLAELDKAQTDASAAAKVLMSWATVGQKAVGLLEPLMKLVGGSIGGGSGKFTGGLGSQVSGALAQITNTTNLLNGLFKV